MDAIITARTIKPVDRLTTLPPELQHLMFDYLLVNHIPDAALYLPDSARHRKRLHDLDKLAATCRVLRTQLNLWADHWLISHASITKYKRFKTHKRQQTRKLLRGRGALLNWLEIHCMFCGKLCTARNAVFVSELRCCAACDDEQWPKIPMEAAKKAYGLQDYHLRPDKHFSPSMARHMPKIRHRSHTSWFTGAGDGIPTTIFLVDDVVGLARKLRGTFPSPEEQAAALERRKADEEHSDLQRAKAHALFSCSKVAVSLTREAHRPLHSPLRAWD